MQFQKVRDRLLPPQRHFRPQDVLRGKEQLMRQNVTWPSRKCNMLLRKAVNAMAKCPHHEGPRGGLSFHRNLVTPSTFPQIVTSGWDTAVFSND